MIFSKYEDLAQHVTECKHIKIKQCQYYNYKDIDKQVDRHSLKCELAITKCQLFDTEVFNKDLTEHLKNVIIEWKFVKIVKRLIK